MVLPPEYPTLASSKPFPLPKFLRKRCSTPQKQPAARVAVCCVLDIFDEDCAAAELEVPVRERRMGEVVEMGRMKRWRRKEGVATKDIGR